LLLLPLEDTRPGGIQAEYDHAWKLFQQGDLTKSQQIAHEGARQFRIADPAWASKFQLLEAESLLFRGMYEEALRLLDAVYPASDNPEGIIRKCGRSKTHAG
jgi:hypothetical protein